MHFMVIFRDGNIHLYRNVARAKTKTKPPLYKLLERSFCLSDLRLFRVGRRPSDTLLLRAPHRRSARKAVRVRRWLMGAESRNDYATAELPVSQQHRRWSSLFKIY